jgi:Leucine-rich repeat (LRR) protein
MQQLSTDLDSLAPMNLEAFLAMMPADLGDIVVPASRALQLRRVSKRTRAAVARLQCRVDVLPGKMIRQQYANDKSILQERRAAVRLFVMRSVQLCMSDFRIRSFTLHGMVVDGTVSFITMLQYAQGLEVLDLYNNHIPEHMLGNVLAEVPVSLKVLRLTRQWINRAAVTPLCALLARLTQLEELDLSENYLNSSGMGAITASVSSPRLAHMTLGFNHLKSRFWNEHPELGLDRFVLTTLDLRHNMLQAVYCDSMYGCVRGSAAVLQTLDLSYNDLRIVGISYLSTALQPCRTLRHLNIAGNLCGDAALALLLAAVRPRENQQCMALESLDVAHNDLTSAGARSFRCCLSENLTLQRSLTSVSFANNDLHDAGAEMVIEALLPCPVTKLNLAQCKMGETAGLSLAGTMLHWPALETLDVHGNHLCSTSLLLLAGTMSDNGSSTKHMQFIGNWILSDLNEQMEQILQNGRVSHGFVQRHTPRALARA